MIKTISIQEAYKSKIARQQKFKGLKFQCYGSCAYVGQNISQGCYGCFYSDAYRCSFKLGRDFDLPDICNKNCLYCFEPHQVSQHPAVPGQWEIPSAWKDFIRYQTNDEKARITTACKMQYYEFSGVCEPLLYLPVLTKWMRFLRDEIDSIMGTRGWAKVYTNGTLLNLNTILQLKESGFDEVRVHLGATNFSEEVYDNLRTAVKYIPTVTVETPAWPLHKQKLFEMLPIIEEIGVKHLNICQIEITHRKQLENIERALGEIKLYQAFYPVIDDGGLVEEIMREVLNKGYSFSVLDCNGFVKQSRNALSNQSFWSIFNRKYPSEWEYKRFQRKIEVTVSSF